MGGEEPPKVPDWKQYKVEGVPQLTRARDRLASYGLKYHWFRNHVWYYDVYNKHRYGASNQTRSALKFLFRGFIPGCTLGIIHALIRKYVYPARGVFGHDMNHH